MPVNESFIFIVYKLLHSNNYVVDKNELIFQLNSNPFYPSLRAVTGSLKHFAKECYAVELPVNKAVLSQLPQTFIAQIKRAGQELFVYVENKKQDIFVYYSSVDKQKFSQENFLDIWTGVIVAIEQKPKTSKKQPSNYGEILIGVLIAILIGLFIKNNAGTFEFAHFLLSLLGVWVCWLIVMYEMGMQSSILDKICMESNDVSGCDAVMNSSGAKLFGKIKLSDIGIIYFISLSFIWVFSLSSHSSQLGIVMISCIAIPFTLYSIFYQFWVVKKWCPLCLTVVSVLWLQALSIMFYKFNNVLSIDLNSILIILFSFVFTAIAWRFISAKIESEKNFHEVKANYYRFKRNFSSFKRIIFANPIVNINISGISEIIYGNRNASLNLCFITSPSCGYCKEVHAMIGQILTLANGNVQITVRFNINVNSTNNQTAKICSRLLELFHIQGQVKCMEAMDDIYGGMLPSKWIQKWGEVKDSSYNNVLIEEREWCLNNNVDFTPEIFINGREFPREYERTDLLFFVEGLVENQYSDQIKSNASKEIFA